MKMDGHQCKGEDNKMTDNILKDRLWKYIDERNEDLIKLGL